jgi:signal transduction histidine kinase
MDAMNSVPADARKLKVRVTSKDISHLELSVSDSGTGLPVNDGVRLFEPFFTTKPNGMGMGLAISRTIIEAHGGKIRGENNLKAGATFTIVLPATEVEI